MLFDLRSRRRRHTVRVVYLFLAIVMVAGLVLVGVGTGNNNGGLLNAFTNNGSGSSQNQAVDQQLKAALKQVKLHPGSASAWAGLMSARWSVANANVSSTTGAFSKLGTEQLNAGVLAWQKYLGLTNEKPNLGNSLLAAKFYQALGHWSPAATAWQYVIQTQPAGSSYTLKGYQCVALNAYAAKQSSKGDLASAAALKVMPKIDKLTWQSTAKAAKQSATTAQQSVITDC